MPLRLQISGQGLDALFVENQDQLREPYSKSLPSIPIFGWGFDVEALAMDGCLCRVGDRPFGIVGDLTTGNHYDHFVDGGQLMFPEGDVELVG